MERVRALMIVCSLWIRFHSHNMSQYVCIDENQYRYFLELRHLMIYPRGQVKIYKYKDGRRAIKLEDVKTFIGDIRAVEKYTYTVEAQKVVNDSILKKRNELRMESGLPEVLGYYDYKVDGGEAIFIPVFNDVSPDERSTCLNILTEEHRQHKWKGIVDDEDYEYLPNIEKELMIID